jgi:hypothetical protein
VAIKTERFPAEDWDPAVRIRLRDDDYPWLIGSFVYRNLDGFLDLVSVTVEEDDDSLSREEISVWALRREYPWGAWQRAARSAAADELWSWGLRPGEVDRDIDSMDTRLLLVAAEYRENLKAGVRDPVARIARRHKVPPGTARSWVHRARNAGMLGEAKDRAAGEVAAPKPPTTPDKRSGPRGAKRKPTRSEAKDR